METAEGSHYLIVESQLQSLVQWFSGLDRPARRVFLGAWLLNVVPQHDELADVLGSTLSFRQKSPLEIEVWSPNELTNRRISHAARSIKPWIGSVTGTTTKRTLFVIISKKSIQQSSMSSLITLQS
jgi:hypothetical protein